MNRLISVECHADRLFFERLLKNDRLIIKEKNKQEVIKGIRERAKGNFRVGIVDHDNEEITRYFKDVKLEIIELAEGAIDLVAISDKPHYLIQLKPKEFENFLVNYIENYEQKKIIEFGYNSVKEITTESKVISERLVGAMRLNQMFNFILEHYIFSENPVHKLKRTLDYLITYQYQVDLNELKNV
ncbi:MAG: hypothetical protein MUF24_13570 [Chitinophagaceae bacterium]|jgi:hypothetical protein|nr:hypothetical protein [Chitinophagaceae bacterium]